MSVPSTKESAPSGPTQAQIAERIPWSLLANRVFKTLDSDCNGFLDKMEIRMSDLNEALMPHWDEMHGAKEIVDGRKTGHIDRFEWTAWMETILKKRFKGDDAKMRMFCAGLIWNGDIDVVDLWTVVGSVTTQEIVERFEWRSLTNKIFKTLDTDFDGRLSKEEMKNSDVGKQLFQFWSEMDAQTKKDGHVSFDEWNKWFDRIFIVVSAVLNEDPTTTDDEAMRTYCAGLVEAGGIDISDMWDDEGALTLAELSQLPWQGAYRSRGVESMVWKSLHGEVQEEQYQDVSILRQDDRGRRDRPFRESHGG